MNIDRLIREKMKELGIEYNKDFTVMGRTFYINLYNYIFEKVYEYGRSKYVLLGYARNFLWSEEFKELRKLKNENIKFEELIENVKQWSIDRNLNNADSTKQFIKLAEEFGEMAQGIAKNNKDQVVDSIGDMLVVLTIYCQQENIELKDCFAAAWNEIRNRKGKMINGVFVKEEDL